MTTFDHDAILRDWVLIPLASTDENGTERRVVIGLIEGDRRQRFSDGTRVTTSNVQSLDGDQLVTRNTRYLLKDPKHVHP